MSRKGKIITNLILFVVTALIFLVVATFIYFFMMFRYADEYTLKSNFNEDYVKKLLVEEMDIKIPNNAKIIEIKFQRVWDASEYKVTYLENNQKKVEESYRDADGIQLDQYIKANGKSSNTKVLVITILIILIPMMVPAFFLRRLIKAITEDYGGGIKLDVIKKIIYLVIIAFACYGIFYVHKMEIPNDNKVAYNKHDILRPDRMIYKNRNNEYIIINSGTNEYEKIYFELYDRIYKFIDGKVYSEDQISNMQDKGSFIEFDYNTKSKNFVFMFDEKEIGIIRRSFGSGQVSQIRLENVEQLVKEIDNLTKNNLDRYSFDRTQNYTSENTLEAVTKDLELNETKGEVYQKVIEKEEKTYIELLRKLNFKSNKELPKVDFSRQSVIIIVSKFEIENIKQNIGNVKYEYGKKFDKYIVNLLVVSKVVNVNCIYNNINNTLLWEESHNQAIDNIDTTIFLQDFENYAPVNNEVKITEIQAKEIAEKGFEETIYSNGMRVNNASSETIKVEEVCANNYFTRRYDEPDEVYTEIKRKCYIVQREDVMKCGVAIYVDVTTGLIIGGYAFGV